MWEEKAVVIEVGSADQRAKLRQRLFWLFVVVVWAHQDREGPEKAEKLEKGVSEVGRAGEVAWRVEI
ncbi:MAG: hypothetical protein GY820_03800 [Gammaproteobacteria bacterium]|nr:hypothetical protein [Gammaproteobacteria bacterium]